MHCRSCNHQNGDGMLFCTECGVALPRLCPRCAAESVASAKFCGQCGMKLTDSTQQYVNAPMEVRISQDTTPYFEPIGTVPLYGSGTPAVARPYRQAAPMERRHLTVMFCDLADSAALSAHLDPEDLHQVIRAYHESCATVIHRYEGYIAQYLGDGILVYFSYPSAHEDDPQRAARTALGILRTVQQLNARLVRDITALEGRTLAVRIGIHTGYVVVGDVGQVEKAEPIALGEAPNIAARLQALAEPGSVLVTAATWRLIDGYFAGRALGVKTLKGFAQPQGVYQVLAESGVASRFEIAVTSGLTPLVGRDEQIELLLRCWDSANDNLGQVVLLRGEPGIGKSRLVQTFKERIAKDQVFFIDCSGSPYFQNTAFYPIIELLQRVFRFEQEDSVETKIQKLRAALGTEANADERLPELLMVLFSLRAPQDDPATANLTPQQLKEQTTVAMLTWLLNQAKEDTLLVVFEDLQWADPSTLELLSRVVEQVATARLFMIVTFRSDFTVPWALRSHIVPISVNRLSPNNAVALVRKLTQGKSLPVEVLEQIVSKTDGVPLFIEELTKMVLGSGWLREGTTCYELAGPLPPLAIPTTLQDSLMARLDRLEAVKEVAQLGATIGREFSYDLLRAVATHSEAVLAHALQKLVEAEVLYPHGVDPNLSYRFKHALIQDAAYQSLLRIKRQHYHQQIANVLETQFSNLCEAQPELLAYHCTEAGNLEQAVCYWHKAGGHAIARSANQEGIAHLERGLQILAQLPHTAERAGRELSMWLALGVGYMATRGVAAPEVGNAFQKARQLAERSSDKAILVPVLRGMARYYLVRGEFSSSLQYGGEFLQLAEASDDANLRASANYVVGCAHLFCGNLVEGDERLAEGLKLRKMSGGPPSGAMGEPFDTEVACHAFGALALWYIGYPDKALARCRRSLILADQLGQPYSLVAARNLAAMLHMLRGEYEETLSLTEAQLPMCDEMGFSLYIALGIMLRGWALARSGRSSDGGNDVRQGLIAYRATGASVNLPFILGVIAEDLGQRGHVSEALTLVREAIETLERTGERLNEADMYRLKGELLMQGKTARPKDIEATLRTAVSVGRSISAKSQELRATISLSQFLHAQGKTVEAVAELAAIRSWFTEGFDTSDLRRADELLMHWRST